MVWDTSVLVRARNLNGSRGKGEQAMLLFAVLGSLLSRKDLAPARGSLRENGPEPLSEGLPGLGVLEFIGLDERAF